MFTVHKSNVTLDAELGKLVGEASTMGFPVGEWPQHVAVLDDKQQGFLFQRGDPIRLAGELGGFNYHTRDGRFTLTVFND